MPYYMGNKSEKANYTYKIFKNFFSKGTGQISTDLGTKHRWVNGIKVFSNAVSHLFSSTENKNK